MVSKLLEKDKRDVAVFLKSECFISSSNKLLMQLLDHLLGPKTKLNKLEIIDWCRTLISGGHSYSSFGELVHSFNSSSLCGLVWNADYVAYRCRTCAKTPCMSLCSECFMAADHEGHDFNMFKSQAGGACDCGDENVMDLKGFCSKHCKRSDDNLLEPPSDLLILAKAVVPRLLVNLLYILGHQNIGKDDLAILEEVKSLIEFLQELSDMGTIMQNILCSSICDKQLYLTYFKDPSSGYFHDEKYQMALTSLACTYNISSYFPELSHLDEPLIHTSILDELFFWTIKYQFSQGLVTFILSLLPNENYKSNFVIVFMKHYKCSMNSMCLVEEKPRVSNAIVHISVQLLSPMYLAVQTVEKHHLMQMMLVCLEHIIRPSLMKTGPKNILVVNCSQGGNLKEHCYWPIVTDVVNVLSHRPVIEYFLSNSSLVAFWAKIVSYFQGMNLNKREIHHHLEFEPEGYYQAFSAELEICSTPLWTMLMHLNDHTLARLTTNVISSFQTILFEWLDATEEIKEDTMSFHYPLHRYLSLFISNAIQYQGMNTKDLIPSDELLRKLLLHPLHLLACYSEINCNVWVRNGQQIKGQAMFYTHWNFASSTMDPDYFLIQVIASRLDPDEVMMMILKEYHVMDVLSLGPAVDRSYHLHPEHELPMLEACLYFLATLLDIRVLSGDVKNLIPNELIGLLCVADRTHSHLTSSIPDRCGSHNPDWINAIETALPKVSHFKPPVFEIGTAPQQGKYLPQAHIWIEKYNPLFVRMRTLYKKDFQASYDRYCDFVKQQNLYKGSSAPWPPFRLPEAIHPSLEGLYGMLHCRSMHALLFSLLYKALVLKSFPESVLHLAIHLLHLAVTLSSNGLPKERYKSKEFKERAFGSWFTSNDIFENATLIIPHVLLGKATDNTDEEKCLNKFNFLLKEEEISKSSEGHLIIVINESMITMLVKLYAKFSKEPYFYDGFAKDKKVSYIGDGRLFIKNVLDKLCSRSDLCAKEVAKLCEVNENPGGTFDNVQDRRLKAKLRQQRLLSDFASKQKKFMEEVIVDSATSELTEDEHSDNAQGRTFDCCICSLSTPSTSSKPICMAARVYPTSVLGWQRVEHSKNVLLYSTQLNHFNESITKDFCKVPEILWYETSYLHTCGHFMHFDCYLSYIKSLQSQNPLTVLIEKGEFFCPMCRQISNTILPLIEESVPLTQFIPSCELKDTEQIEKLLEVNLHEMEEDTQLNRAVVLAMDDFWKNSLCKPSSQFYFSASLLRNNLELNLLNFCSKKKFCVTSMPRKSCIYPLFVILSNFSKKFCPSFLALLWRHITTTSLSRSFEKFEDIPLLLKDISDIFVQYLLALPVELEENHFCTLVRTMYNVKLIQILINVVYNSSLQEISTWLETCFKKDLGFIIKLIIKHISDVVPAVLSYEGDSVWKALGIEVFVMEHMLPYLRMVSLMHHCVYNSFGDKDTATLPTFYAISSVLEFKELSNYLHLSDDKNEIGFVGLSLDEGSELIRKMCQDIESLGSSNASKLKNLVEFRSSTWKIPVLINLPEEFDTLFQSYRKQPCKGCHGIPKCPSLCLICDKLICYNDSCCSREDLQEYVWHTLECGNGTGLYIGIDSSFVLIVQNNRTATWGSLYLDKHGEEDKNLRRGKPLYLNKERYNLLNHMWLTHSLDQLCKQWTIQGN